MNLKEAIEKRHSVRAYTDRPISEDAVKKLNERMEEYNREGGLHIQLVLNEPQAFDSLLAHYGKFSGVSNYIALIAKKSEGVEEKIGYYGEKLVLLAQTLGLNTCWVALTYKKVKDAFVIDQGEKLFMVISLGYGKTQGVARRSKTAEKVSFAAGEAPEWFQNGVKAALLAPTAINQQQFFFTLKEGNVVEAKAKAGFHTKVDLGIAKCHFELGAGKENFTWSK